MVRQGADVTMVNREGQTAVELASSTVIRQLLLAAVDQGGPLHNLCQAAWQGNVAVLQRILVREPLQVYYRRISMFFCYYITKHWLQFLANVNSRSRSLYAISRPSVVCLSVVCRLCVTLVHPTQAVELFGNFFHHTIALGLYFSGAKNRWWGTPPSP